MIAAVTQLRGVCVVGLLWVGMLVCAAEDGPTDVPDPYGFGERLALIAWLRDNGHDPSTGASVAELRAAYRAANQVAVDEAELLNRDRQRRVLARLRHLGETVPDDLPLEEALRRLRAAEERQNQSRVVSGGSGSPRPMTPLAEPVAPTPTPAAPAVPAESQGDTSGGHVVAPGDAVDWAGRERVAMRALRVARASLYDDQGQPIAGSDGQGLECRGAGVLVVTGFAVERAPQAADLLREVAVQADAFIASASGMIGDIAGRRPRLDRLTVVLQRRLADAPGIASFRIRGDEFWVSLAIGIGDRDTIDDNVVLTLRHELTHAILQTALQDRIPPGWLHEAMATYFEPWDPSRRDNRHRLAREGDLFTRARSVRRDQLIVDPRAGWMLGDTGNPIVYPYGQAFMHFLLHDTEGRRVREGLFGAIRAGDDPAAWLASQRRCTDGTWTRAWRAHCARMGWAR